MAHKSKKPPWMVQRTGTGLPPVAVYEDKDLVERLKRGYTLVGGARYEKGERPMEIRVVDGAEKLETVKPEKSTLPERLVPDPVAKRLRAKRQKEDKAAKAARKAELEEKGSLDNITSTEYDGVTARRPDEPGAGAEGEETPGRKRGRPKGSKNKKKAGKKTGKKKAAAKAGASEVGTCGEGVAGGCGTTFKKGAALQKYCEACLATM